MGTRSSSSAGRRFAGEGLTIPAVIDAQAAERPDQTALHLAGVPLSYRRLAERSASAASALSERDIGPGDRVAILMATSPEWVVLWFGLSRRGAVTVPVNTAYKGEFLAHQLRDCGATMIAVDAALLDRVLAIAADVPSLQTVLVCEGDDGEADRWPSRVRGVGRLAFESITCLDAGDPGGAESAARWNQPGAIFYTSGTTGSSKGALATQHYLLSAAQTMVDCWKLQPGETVYAPLPLFHLSAVGSVLGPLLAGGTGVIDRAFSVQGTWDQVRRHQAVGLLGAGAMVNMLWSLPADERDRDLPIRFLSAAPVDKELYHAIQARWGCRIVTCYGLSEAFPLTVAGVDDDNPPGASGRANPDFEVMLVDAEDREVPVGTVGEIVCRPRRPHVMFEGYSGRDRETVEQTRNLWFHTGDLGRFDQEGSLYYADRKKDAMRRRGENISSFEIEQALARYEPVAEVAVIGVPSELGEDDVMVYVVAKPGFDLDVVPFMDFCGEQLPYFAVPRYVEVCGELPKNAVGRVLKHELRALGVGDSAWDRDRAGYVVRR
ncbi:MAG: carnitine-CoA ligase [Acidimicrobiaceae bacterium]|jgi:crotonobetaine/carnitine-CoA ligase|nr:carnitine-CoA ligase [Acidimicrobiaceae bacterium]